MNPMAKRTVVGLVLTAVLAIPATMYAQGTDEVVLRIVEVNNNSSDVHGAPNGQVTMRVTAEGTSNMAGIQFDIDYDRAVVIVRPENIEQGTVPSGFFMQVNPNGERGTITFAIAGASALGVDSLEVATITFDLVGDDGTATALTFTGELAGDASAPPKRLTVTKHGGRISIFNAPLAPTAGPDAQGEAAPTPPRNAPTPELAPPGSEPLSSREPESSGGLCSAPPAGTPLTAGLANGLLLVLPVAALAFRGSRFWVLGARIRRRKPEARGPNL